MRLFVLIPLLVSMLIFSVCSSSPAFVDIESNRAASRLRDRHHGSFHRHQFLRAARMDERERQEEYKKRGYKWPLIEKDYVPNTAGWRQLMEHRISQVWQIPTSSSNDNNNYRQRYNGWLSVMTSATSVVPNFTETGFLLKEAPPDLLKELKQSLHSGLRENRTRLELGNEIIVANDYGNNSNSNNVALPPLFIDQDELNAKVLKELQPMHEEFAGNIDLIGAKAYGLRLYQNQSSLLMHTDKINTHIIASVLHIDHSPDSKPWPIVLEDYNGNTHEIVMDSGDILLYESSKLYHGRPRPFDGSWYCSIFTHYYPADWDTNNMDLEAHYAVPPIWFEEYEPAETEEPLERLEVVGTAVREPECEYGWGGLANSVKHYPPLSPS